MQCAWTWHSASNFGMHVPHCCLFKWTYTIPGTLCAYCTSRHDLMVPIKTSINFTIHHPILNPTILDIILNVTVGVICKLYWISFVRNMLVFYIFNIIIWNLAVLFRDRSGKSVCRLTSQGIPDENCRFLPYKDQHATSSLMSYSFIFSDSVRTFLCIYSVLKYTYV